MIDLSINGGSITGWFTSLTDSFIHTPIYYLSIGLVVAAVLLMVFYTIGNVKHGQLWYGLFLGAVAVIVAMIAQQYLNLFTVIYLGLTFSDMGAFLFVAGMVMFMVVIASNLIRTNGKHAVR